MRRPPSIREQEVLLRIRQGKTNKQIALELGISGFTVRDHVSALLKKLSASNRTELAIMETPYINRICKKDSHE